MGSGHESVRSEVYQGVRLVYAPPVKWYYFSLPYTSQLERELEPARSGEEAAVVVAPDRFTALMLKLEGFGPAIPVIHGERAAKQHVDDEARHKGNSK